MRSLLDADEPSAPGEGPQTPWETRLMADEQAMRSNVGDRPGPAEDARLPIPARVAIIAALVRVLVDLATPARGLVSAVNALLAVERQQLRGRPGDRRLLPGSVRTVITDAMTRVLLDESTPARIVISASNALLSFERNGMAAERERLRHERELGDDDPDPRGAADQRHATDERRHAIEQRRNATDEPRDTNGERRNANGERRQPSAMVSPPPARGEPETPRSKILGSLAADGGETGPAQPPTRGSSSPVGSGMFKGRLGP